MAGFLFGSHPSKAANAVCKGGLWLLQTQRSPAVQTPEHPNAATITTVIKGHLHRSTLNVMAEIRHTMNAEPVR